MYVKIAQNHNLFHRWLGSKVDKVLEWVRVGEISGGVVKIT